MFRADKTFEISEEKLTSFRSPFLLIFNQTKLLMKRAVMIIGFGIFLLPAMHAQCTNAPDLVIINANIITMDPTMPLAHALAVRNGTIQVIGELEDILALLPEDCPVKWIDAAGYTVLPGFNDSHTHWFSWPEHICDAPGQQQTTYPPLESIMDTLSRYGWTSISELNFGRPGLIPEHLQNAMALEASGNLNVRLNGYWGTYDQLDLIDELQSFGYGPGHVFSPRIKVPGVKMYVDDPFGTMDIMDQSTCTQLVSAAHAAGFQVAAHCVNVTAIEKILTAYESVLGSGNNSQIRHRIEHAVKVSDDQMDRIQDKGILLSFQLMGPPDWPEQNTFQTYISNTNTDYVLRWKDFLENDIQVTGSTDAPFNNTTCHYSPFRVIYQAVTRKGYIDRMHAPWELSQRIAIGEALKLLTIDGAWATKEEDVKGSLAVGKYADLTIVSHDPLDVAQPEELLGIHSLLTMVGGEIEYCSDAITDFCEPPTAFRVDSVIVTVSNYLNDQKPGKAFDSDEESSWGAGDYPPQYIQVDLLKNTTLERIELVVDQFPAGFTRHQVLGAQEGQSMNLSLLHEFTGNTDPLQTLGFDFVAGNNNFRYVRVATLQSPSWVAWREIRLLRPGTTSIGSPGLDDVFQLVISPNPVKDELNVDLQLIIPVSDAEISIRTIDGRSGIHVPLGNLTAGSHHFHFSSNQLASLGPGILIVIVKAGGLTSFSRIVRM
jgi:predicted amidohydrolase YtcJ